MALIPRNRWTTSGIALRGTVMSSPSLFGALRANEGEIDRRAFHKLLRSASSCAILTERAPFS